MLLDFLKFLRERALPRRDAGPARSTGSPADASSLDRLRREAAREPNAGNLNALGAGLQATGRLREALEAYESAIASDASYQPAYFNRGLVLGDLHDHERALQSFDTALALGTPTPDLHIARGNSLAEVGRHEEALACYSKAIELAPDFAEAHLNHGAALRELNRTPDALRSFERGLRLKPDHAYLFGLWLFNKMAVCDWQGIDEAFAKLFDCVARGIPAATPFTVIVAPSSPAQQLKAAQDWVRAHPPSVPGLPDIGARPRAGKIRLGYFSADFHEHATAHLIAEVFERHDRSRFEITAFSFGADRDDPMRNRLRGSFDRFVDAHRMTDQEVALRSRDLGIDIALDLKGFSQESRAGIFALRAAPVQVNYLGFPGTMGAPFMDYLLADPVLVPEAQRHFFTEKIAYLPHTYQPNDSTRAISGHNFTRGEAGLPPEGFVFCCFNNNFKILPAMFGRWMRILSAVPGSVLWLLEDNAAVAAHLRKEAAGRGVDPGRLVFASRVAAPLHLARHKLAGLFLDTLPCNAHTTASDALWAGLPLLTCAGEAFAGRVAASLLTAIGLPDLIASNFDDYETLAVALAMDPGRLEGVRQALIANRRRMPLFDSALMTRHLESAYETMYERRQRGLPPADFQVQPLKAGAGS